MLLVWGKQCDAFQFTGFRLDQTEGKVCVCVCNNVKWVDSLEIKFGPLRVFLVVPPGNEIYYQTRGTTSFAI